MGALRKAGVWLGLVEEDDERGYEDGGYDKGGYRDSRYRSSRYAEEFADEEDDEAEEPPAPRARIGDRGRLTERAPSRGGRRTDRVDGGAARSGVGAVQRPVDHPVGARGDLRRADLPHPGQPRPGAAGRSCGSGRWSPRRSSATRSPRCTRPPTGEARTIGEHFRDGVPVIINLTEMDEADARRLVDFAAGLAFGLRGTIERVTNRVFLLSPANVQVTAEDKAKIAEGGFFSLS